MAAPRTRTNKFVQPSTFPLEKRLAAAREGIGLLLLGLSVFVFLALLTFHRDDPSFNHAGGAVTRNMAGKAGAYLSDALFQVVGLSAFLVPLLFLFLGWKMLRNQPTNFYWDRWISLPVLVWTLSMLFIRLLPAALVAWLPAGSGGMVGKMGLGMMHRHFGQWGTLALILPLCFLSFMVLTHFSLAGLVQAMGKIVGVFTLLMPKPKPEEGTHGEGAKVVAPAINKPQPEQPAATRILPQPVEVKEWVVSMAEKSELRPRATSLFMGVFLVVKKVLVGIWQLFFGEEKTERPRNLDRQDPEIDGQIAAPDVDDLFLEDGEPWQSDRHKPGSKKEKAEFPPEFDFPTLEEPAATATAKPKEADPFHIPEVHLRPTPPVVTPTVEQPAVVIVEKKEAVTEPPKVEEDSPEEEEEEEEEIIDNPVPEEEEEEDDDTWSDEALELVKQVAEPPGLVQTSFTPAAPAPVQPAPKPRPPVPPPVIGEAGVLPPLDLLTWGDNTTTVVEPAALQSQARLIEQKLADFSVKGSIVEVHPGPVVTTFELDPAPGLKSAKVVGLADDLARSISAASVRVVGNIPGKSVIGIEVPNAKRQTVWLRQILESSAMNSHKSPLAVALGSDITGNPVVGDLARMPHLLVAGTTGSGKSVAVNAMICTILFRSTPDQVQFLMVDPKMLELSIYEGIPHLLAPVVTEVKKASTLLKWAVSEMEDRYRLMSEMGVRNLAGYNAKIDECKANGSQPTRRVKAGFDPETGEILEREEAIPLEHKPLIVIVIDELADLMMQVGKEVEPAIARLAQMARAAGLHLILATQRPSVDVITGLIKANFPTRLAFQVSSRIDSRTILDAQGAEHLLGMGDGLYQPPGTSRMIRIHAPFVADNEVHALVDFLKKTGRPRYNPSILSFRGDDDEGGGDEAEEDAYDELYDQAVSLVIRSRKASTSMVQRHFKIGYNRAARIVERMAREGLVSEANSAGKREVLVPNNQD